MKSKFMRILLLGVMAISISISAFQLTAKAEKPNCVDLSCADKSDCGSLCFCNRPLARCIEDAASE